MLGNNKKSIGFNSTLSNNKSNFDYNYQAILTEATAQGYTLPSTGQQVKQNTLLNTLISSGVWNKLDVFYCFANDGSKEFATLNWKNPSLNQASLISSPTFTSNQGFTGNGTSSYIDTNYAPTGLNNYTLNNASRYVYIKTLIANKIIDGVEPNTANSITTFASVLQRINQSGSNLSSSFDFGTSGFGMKSIHRLSSTIVTCYNDTNASTGLTATSTGLASSNQLILRSASNYSAHQISMYAMGASMISENSNFVSAFANYLSSL